MTWIAESAGYTSPAYYLDSADHNERQLRADFAKYYQLREIAPFGLTPADTAEMNHHADDLATRWGYHESPHWRQMWKALQGAVISWEARPDLARRNFDQLDQARRTGDFAVDDDLWRTLQQARAITGHGTDLATGSAQDAVRRFPNLDSLPVLASHAPIPGPQSDTRTAFERTLGAPRDRFAGAPVVTLDQIQAIITATDAALDAEERAGDLDTGHDARATLLPRAIREAPISYNYAQSEAWELRQAALLREVQDLACEHATVADAFDGHDDQDRITRLEALRNGLAAARRDALRAGVPAPDVDRAYILGRDGIYWSTEPSHPRLGRIAQLSDERDHARAEAAALRSRYTAQPAPNDIGSSVTRGFEMVSGSTTAIDQSMQSAHGDGARIVEAIDAVLADANADNWTETGPTPPPPAPAIAEINLGVQP
ncbi:hypothetical protein ACFXO9_26765 [Nocardia tengchongensis]|uniref:hypothetical protein n=1 Tax=Nocardia tengchongensis TaxID=2055889 RepID=UPI00368FEC4F